MSRLLASLTVVLLAAAPAAAQQKDVMVPVNQFIDGFNKGDIKGALAACADEGSIIDEFPPYQWHGAGACGNWANDYDADAKKNGVTEGWVTLAKPLHVNVSADRAYVVVPASYKYKLKGKPVNETGSVLTVALEKGGAGWRITAWTWSKR